jgi:hypothetical protein|tara:strand:- start:1489 stop:1740 length:252 start_codon:yes stop_codon:yes gene_type:complete
MLNQWMRFQLEDVARMIGEVARIMHDGDIFNDNEEQYLIGQCLGWVVCEMRTKLPNEDSTWETPFEELINKAFFDFIHFKDRK